MNYNTALSLHKEFYAIGSTTRIEAQGNNEYGISVYNNQGSVEVTLTDTDDTVRWLAQHGHAPEHLTTKRRQPR